MIKQIATGTILASTILFTASTSAEFDYQGLNDQVQTQQATIEHQQTVLDNHETRIIKLEESKPVNNEVLTSQETPVDTAVPKTVTQTEEAPSTPTPAQPAYVAGHDDHGNVVYSPVSN